MTEYDHTERVEQTESGVRMFVESNRGTGTRDQDKVSLEYRGDTVPEPTDVKMLHRRVKHLMDLQRSYHPDEETED